MSLISSRFETLAHVLPENSADASAAQSFSTRIGALYAASQKSNHVFGSPLGPFYWRSRHFNLPRFVYFGPQTHDGSLRLAFLAGFAGTDLRASLAASAFLEKLLDAPELGRGLNLSFFPLVDVLGFGEIGASRSLEDEHWGHGGSPEINLLEKDARARGYHGFIRFETNRGPETEVLVRMRNSAEKSIEGESIELASACDFGAVPVSWAEGDVHDRVTDGPLTIADDLPVRAFEVKILLPDAWSPEKFSETIQSFLLRFVFRHGALQAYGQHL